VREAAAAFDGPARMSAAFGQSPVAIGGVGGSGTRLVAQLLEVLGFHLGTDLNRAHDNLWFTLLFKREEVLESDDREFDGLLDIFVRAMHGGRPFDDGEQRLIDALAADGRGHADVDWLRARAQSLKDAPMDAPSGRWGWKEPNTHIVLDRLLPRMPKLKFIQVVRNGLDMAYSSNQNQLKLWGQRFLGRPVEVTPHDSLRYWCVVHRRVLEIGAGMGEHFLWLDYDALCADADTGIAVLCNFLKMEADESTRLRLRARVQMPESTGRHREHGLQAFDPADLEWVRSRGFRVGD
jgi:hypothetical protein